MSTIILSFGLVFVIEGLALALAPSRMATVAAILSAMSVDQRRRLGLAAVAAGVFVAALAKWLGA